MSVGLAQVERDAMSLPAADRAKLADRLWESLAEHHPLKVLMSTELEALLDEGLESADQAKTTDELRRRQ